MRNALIHLDIQGDKPSKITHISTCHTPFIMVGIEEQGISLGLEFRDEAQVSLWLVNAIAMLHEAVEAEKQLVAEQCARLDERGD